MDSRVFSFEALIGFIPQLLPYLLITLLVAFLTLVFGVLIGALLCYMQLSKNKALVAFVHGYTYIMRCTPSIVMLFIVYYGLPKLVYALFNVDINSFSRVFFAVLAFSLIFGAYIKEVFRSAYLSIPKGQFEAGISNALTKTQTFFHIILPQLTVVALPNFCNSAISMLKESSIAYTIGLVDLIGRGNEIISLNYGAYGMEVYIDCIILYFVASSIISWAFLTLERRFSVYKARS